MKVKVFLVAALFFASFLAASFAATSYRVSDRSKVYYGVPEKISNPSTVEIQKVFDRLASYQEAIKLPEGSAKREHALKKASDEFKGLLAKVCKKKKHRFVAEKGVLVANSNDPKNPATVPDITDELIKAISAK